MDRLVLYIVSNVVRGVIEVLFVVSDDQSPSTPLQRAKRTVSSVIQSLEDTDAIELKKWLKESYLGENENFGRFTNRTSIFITF